MNSTSSIALSGMNVAQTALDASANNVANSATPGYRRLQVSQTAGEQGGVTAQVQRARAEGAALETDRVAQLQARNAFLANLQVFKAADRMAGSLLDTRA